MLACVTDERAVVWGSLRGDSVQTTADVFA
jgi:hypothetical protein